MDKDFGSPDEPLGTLEYDLSKMTIGQKVNKWFPLKNGGEV